MEKDPAMLSFDYWGRNGLEQASLLKWYESGRYLVGMCLQDGRRKAYRIDLVQSYHDGAERLLKRPRQDGPWGILAAKIGRSGKTLQVHFAGFTPAGTAELRSQAEAAGWQVMVSGITKTLDFLVIGAGVSEQLVDKARRQWVYILTEEQYQDLNQRGQFDDEVRLGFGSRSYSNQIGDPKVYFADWHFAIGQHHWNTLGVNLRTFTRQKDDGEVERYDAWALDALQGFDFRAGDMFYPRSGDGGLYLQVAYNTEDGEVEVHQGRHNSNEKRQGYLAGYEQLAFWLETGRRPTTLRRVFRGNSRAGLLGWELSEGGEA